METDIVIGIDFGSANSSVGIKMKAPQKIKFLSIFEDNYGESNNLNFDAYSSFLLTKAKKISEEFIGKQISKAVIAIPIHFDDSQRQQILNAANNAGLKVLKFISKPTAAAIAYGFDRVDQSVRNVLIFNLESNNLGVSFLTVEDGIFEVKTTIQDPNLGVEQFNNKIIKLFINDFLNKYGIDIKNNFQEIQKIRGIFTTSVQTIVEVPCLSDTDDFSISLTREKFEELCLEYAKECILLVEQILKNSNSSKNQIHNVILVGGPTEIPKVIETLTQYFNGKEPLRNLNPEEVIAYGATMHGYSIIQEDNDNKKVFNKKEVKLPMGDMLIFGKKEARLSKEDIQKMIDEAERNKPVDENFIKKVESKNKLECYIYSVRNVLNDENIKSKLGEEEMVNLQMQIGKTIEWIDFNPNIETEEYESILKKIESYFNPILAKIHRQIDKEELNPNYKPYFEEVD